MDMKNIRMLVLLASVALLAAGCSKSAVVPPPSSGTVACTMEALQCPDGSYVGRQGPMCEFAACPGTSASPVPPPSTKPAPPAARTSGIEGTIVLGPTCPVERFPQEPGCGDRPYQATVQVKTADGSTVVTEFKSDASGAFKVSLAPGTYLLVPEQGKVFPRAATQEVVVAQNAFTHVTIQYDSGMR